MSILDQKPGFYVGEGYPNKLLLSNGSHVYTCYWDRLYDCFTTGLCLLSLNDYPLLQDCSSISLDGVREMLLADAAKKGASESVAEKDLDLFLSGYPEIAP
jgi:hypothetical protein